MARAVLPAPAVSLAALLLAGCSGADPLSIAVYQPPAGSNEVLRGPVAAAPGLELVTGDLVMGPDGTIPAHYHHGEEFLYVIGGSAVVVLPGQPEVRLQPGQGIRIPPGTVHTGRAGPEGVRAVSTWVVPQGKPLRVPVP